MHKRRRDKIQPFEFAIRFSIVYAISSLVTIIFGMTAVFQLVRVSQFDFVREEAMTIATSAANHLDVVKHEQLQDESQENTPNYLDLAADLQAVVQANPDVSSVYTMRPDADFANWYFVVDSTVVEDADGNGVIDPDEDRAHLGEYYDVTGLPELQNSLAGPNADHKITTDKWGQWISGYAPFYNADGAVVGIVGVDFSATHYLLTVDEFRGDILLASAIIFMLSVLFAFIGAQFFHQEDFRIRRVLESKAEELDRLVKKRTEALEEFSAMIVHELRAPLTAQRWTTEYLLDEKHLNRAAVHEALTNMQSASLGMLAIVNNFLDATKLDVGKFTVTPKKGNLPKAVKSVVGEFSSQAQQAGLDLSFRVEGKIPMIPFDAGRIAQLVRNLVSNAVKYTRVGYVLVTVKNNPANKNIRVEVADTGSGISEKNKRALFQPFIRLTKENAGSGLGLAIAKGIVEAHGGEIGVESAKGKGSTFWFELPRR